MNTILGGLPAQPVSRVPRVNLTETRQRRQRIAPSMATATMTLVAEEEVAEERLMLFTAAVVLMEAQVLSFDINDIFRNKTYFSFSSILFWNQTITFSLSFITLSCMNKAPFG